MPPSGGLTFGVTIPIPRGSLMPTDVSITTNGPTAKV